MDTEFPEGMFANKPHEKAPDFAKAKISINARQTYKWIEEKAKSSEPNDKGDIWINLDLLESKAGNYYLSVNNWKPDSKKADEPAFEDDVPF
jgi:hypothetical protein